MSTRLDSHLVSVSALSLLYAACRAWRWTVLAPFLGSCAAVAFTFAMSPVFTSSTRFLPPQGTSSQALALSFSNISGGINSLLPSLGLKNPGDLYVGIARGNTISDRIIERFNLRQVYEQETLLDTRRALQERVAMYSDRDGIVTIEVEDNSPTLAAEIANAYVEELSKLLSEMSTAEAAERRQFFADQLRAAQADLAQSESEMRRAQEETGVLALDEQGRLIIENIARIRAQISAHKVELEALRLHSTPANPEFQKRIVAIRELERELQRLESTKPHDLGNTLVTTGRLPEMGMIYIRKLRNLKYHEAVTEILARQYELARIEEARQQVPLQVIDRATPPDKRTRPKRALVGLITFVTLFLVGLGGCYLTERFKALLEDPEEAAKWRTVKSLFSSRKP